MSEPTTYCINLHSYVNSDCDNCRLHNDNPCEYRFIEYSKYAALRTALDAEKADKAVVLDRLRTAHETTSIIRTALDAASDCIGIANLIIGASDLDDDDKALMLSARDNYYSALARVKEGE